MSWSLSRGRCSGLCLKGKPLSVREVAGAPFWGGMPWSLSEGRHSGSFLRGDTQVCVLGEKPFSWRGNALVFLWVTLISFSEEMLWFLWEEMPIYVQGQMPWFLSEGGCPALCLRRAVFVLLWEETHWSLRMDTLLCVWENALVYGKMLWCLSEERHPGLFLRKVVLVSAWEEKPRSLSEVRHFGLCLKVELWSFSKRNPSGLCQEETLWSFYERRTLVSVSGEML